MLDCLPVGVLVISGKEKIKQANQEIKIMVSPEPESDHASFGNISLLRMDGPSEVTLSSLESIKDRANRNITLRQIIERDSNDDSPSFGSGRAHNMYCEKTGKLYEVKTKYLPGLWPKEHMIAVVKDQTVYSQLLKRQLLEKYQRMLLSSISHEIRNPLNAVEGYCTMLMDLKIVRNPDMAEICRKIQGSVQQMDFIVSGACDLMVNDKTLILLYNDEVSMRTAVQEVIDIVKPSLGQKPVIINSTISDDVPATICTDCKRFKIILFNLLANAVKYTYEGKIDIDLEYSPSTQILTTTMKDTGVGMKEENIGKLFELYSNLEHVNPYNPQGMGLGLTLCRKLSRALGGDITATSALEKGSTFIFAIKNASSSSGNSNMLNIDSSNEAVPDEICNDYFIQDVKVTAPSLILRPVVPCSCPRVLIVDDEATNRLVLGAYLKSMGLTFEEAENGRIAIEKVKKRLASKSRCRCRKYKLILMDINMPEMDGTAATNALIELFHKEKAARAPIVAVTAANIQTRVDIQRLQSLGFEEICNNNNNHNLSLRYNKCG